MLRQSSSPSITRGQAKGRGTVGRLTASNVNRAANEAAAAAASPSATKPSRSGAAEGGADSGVVGTETVSGRAADRSLSPAASRTSLSTAVSFAELIRTREMQQQKLRAQLEEQNRCLREKLGLSDDESTPSPNRGYTSGDPTVPDTAPDGADWLTFESPPTSHPQKAAMAAAGRAEESTPAGGASPGYVTKRQLAEVLSAVIDMRELILRSQTDDMIALQRLRDRVEEQMAVYEKRVALLEARLAAEEKSREVLREEQSEQLDALSESVDELRQLSSRSIQERCAAFEQSFANYQLSLQTLNLHAEEIQERVSASEAAAEARDRQVTSLEVSVKALSDAAARDREMLKAFNDETLYQQKDRLDAILRESGTQLELVEKQLSRAQLSITTMEENVESVIRERMSELESNLHDRVLQHTSFAQTTLEMHHAQAVKKLDELLARATAGVERAQASMDASLQSLEERYAGKVREKVEEVVRQAKLMEDERRAEYPMADSDRVANMIRELEGAATLMEGIAKNVALQGAGATRAGQCPLTQRVVRLENIVDALESASQAASQPAVMFSVETQAGPLSSDFSKHDDLTRRRSVERHLQQELELVAADASAFSTTVGTSAAVLRASSPSTGTGASSSSPRGPSASRPVFPPQDRYASATASPRTSRSSVPSSSLQLPAAQTHTAFHQRHPVDDALAQVVAEREAKEAAAERIQQVLREIQVKFQELSMREPLQRNLQGNSGTFNSNSRRVTELIAKEKEAVYAKERLLVEQRNKLWRDIADLEAQEQALRT